jgi:hypothetical protein
MQSLILNADKADSSYALAKFISVLDVVNWIGLAVKKIKAETLKKYFAKAGFGEMRWQIIWRRRVKTWTNIENYRIIYL